MRKNKNIKLVKTDRIDFRSFVITRLKPNVPVSNPDSQTLMGTGTE